MEPEQSSDCAWLVPLSRDDVMPLRPLESKPEGILVGRHELCDVHLSSEVVSRVHARLSREGSTWCVTDLRSRWGTWVNGVRAPFGSSVRLEEGSLLRFGQLLFRFSQSPCEYNSWWATTEDSTDDLMQRVRGAVTSTEAELSAIDTEEDLARALLQAAMALDLGHASLLRYTYRGRWVKAIASQEGPEPGEPLSEPRHISRGLIQAAVDGEAVLRSAFEPLYGPPLRAAAALPVALSGGDVECVLYLEAPDGMERLDRGVLARCQYLADCASSTLRRLRADPAVAQMAAVDLEHARAAEAQRRLLPPRTTTLGGLRCVARLDAGYQLSGDFFDIVQLDGERLALALGDVSGKGIVASTLAAAVMGYLRATLELDADPVSAVQSLNRYVADHASGGMFVTLWLGVVDSRTESLQYVDAGHGYAAVIREGSVITLRDGGGPPLGIMCDALFGAGDVRLREGDRLLVVSDGIVEQRQQMAPSQDQLSQFGFEEVLDCLNADGRLLELSAAVDEVFTRVQSFAGRRALDDDATAVALYVGKSQLGV